LRLNIVSRSFQQKTSLLEPGHGCPASFRRRLRRQQAEAQFSKDIIVTAIENLFEFSQTLLNSIAFFIV